MGVYKKARSLVNAKLFPTGSINGFFDSAIRASERFIQRRLNDAKFAGMSEDAEYQNEACRISEEFSPSDWEAFEHSEKDAR
jgi:hypothetical protein